jgi:hypothetical protein
MNVVDNLKSVKVINKPCMRSRCMSYFLGPPSTVIANTKCWKVVENDSDRAKLQETLDKLSECADQWGMSFNADKCKVTYIGLRNPRHSYFMN